MKYLITLSIILLSLQSFSQRIRITNNIQQYKSGGVFHLQIDSTGNGGNLANYDNFATWKFVEDYVTAHGGSGYLNGYGLNLSSVTFSVDTSSAGLTTWLRTKKVIDSISLAYQAYVASQLTSYVKKQDSVAGGYYPYSTNPNRYLTNVTNYIQAGSNVTLTGDGSFLNPYFINSTGGGSGGGTNVNLGAGYRWAFPSTNNVRTFFNGYGLLTDSTTNTNGLTTKIDTATVSTYYVRRKDSIAGGYYPYSSNPSGFTTVTAVAAGYVPLTRLINTGVGLSGGGALSSNLTLRADTTYLLYQLPQVTTLTVSKNGSDATGLRGRLDKPFLTIRGALNASSSGDLIIVYPGTYEEATPISLAHNVNFQFIGKGTVQLNTGVASGSVFTDSTTVSASTIQASGWKFEGRSIQKVLNLTAASTVKMYVDELLGSGNGIVINMAASSNLTITANRVAGNAFAGQIWLNGAGRFYGDIKLIESAAFGNAIWISNTKYVAINSERIFVSDTTNDDYLIYVPNSNATDSIYINADEIRSGTEWALWGEGNSPAIHVKAQHISAKSDCVVVSGTNPGGAVYVDADVIENRTTGAMDGIIHGEGGTIIVSRARVIRNPLSTGGDIKTSIFGGDTGYVKLIAVSFDPTHINEVPSGTVTRIDNYFHSGISANGLSNQDSVAYILGYNRTSKQFVTVAKTNPLSGSLVVSLVDGATISTDATQGYIVGATYRVTLGGNRTIANPTGLVDGQRITYEIHQDATGSRSVTWGSLFMWSDDLPLPTLSSTANYVDQFSFQYNQSANKLYVSGINIGIH